jgi:hypothetical protein
MLIFFRIHRKRAPTGSGTKAMSKKWKKAARTKPPAGYAGSQNKGLAKGDGYMSNETQSLATGAAANQAAGPQKLTAAQANDTWLKLIGRYDFYNGSVNTKAAMYVAFNVFVAGGIVLKWKDIQDALAGQKVAFFIVGVFLLVALAASLVSLWYTFRSVNPFLGSPSIPKNYHSLLFFGAVKEFNIEDYHTEVAKLTDEELRRDLAYQAHALAEGLWRKFAALKTATGWILFAQIPALALTATTFLIAWLVDALPKLAN